ncbi:MFS superfamily sulfate permease-like transporter [Psychroflexus sp. MBR-150]|jgi:SulP family sulfate permease
MLLVFVLFGSNLIEQLPMAALTGLMIMVAVGTFEWASLRTFNKFPVSDIVVMVLVTLVTVFLHNLALAVVVGVIIAALVFAWDNAKRIRARKYIDDDGVKHYEIYGPLFFGSTSAFNSKFDIKNDPDEVMIDFTESRVADMSAIEALNKLTERYHKYGKKVYIRNLSSSSHRKLIKADKIINVNIVGEPREPSVVEN